MNTFNAELVATVKFQVADMRARVPPGTQFSYLGAPAVALFYIDDLGKFEGPGLVYEYATDDCHILRNIVEPEAFEAFWIAIDDVEKPQ